MKLNDHKHLLSLLAVLTAVTAFPLALYAQEEVETPADIRRSVREGRIDVHIEGQELTEDEEVAIATGFHSLLSDAIGAAIQEGIARMLTALDADSAIEKSLVIGSLSGDGSPKVGDKATVSVYLIRSGDPTKVPRTIEYRIDDECLIRYCRVYAPVPHPIAIVTETTSDSGTVAISERIMRYNDGTGWEAVRPKIVKKAPGLIDDEAEPCDATEPGLRRFTDGKSNVPAR